MSKTLYFTIATAGHVDHGKTSLLRSLTGIDPDRLKEEKLRQMTTDLGFAHLDIAEAHPGVDFVIGFIDVPGHGKFLKNMLAGVGGIDVALLVVAADEGPMPQTVAHVKILSLLGVKQAIVALTKIDMASEQMQDDALRKTEELLDRFGVKRLDCVKIASPTGHGIDELKLKLKGSLASAIRRDDSDQNAPVYLPIDRVFSKSGYGVVITGTLVRGTVKVGDSLFIEPGGLKPRVRGLETFGKSLQTAQAGQRLAINLTFREHTSLARGQTILGEHVSASTNLIVHIIPTADVAQATLKQQISGQPIRLYHGTAECPGDLRWVDAIDVDGESKLVAQISLTESVVVEPGDRFVLRYGDDGITGGVILSNGRPRWLTRPKLMDLCGALLKDDYRGAVNLFLDACSQRTVREDVLTSLLPQTVRGELTDKMVADSDIFRLAQYLATKESIQLLGLKLLREVAQQKPEGEGDKQTSLETIRGKVLPGIDRAAFQALIKHLTDSGQVVRKGDRLSLPGAEQAVASKSEDRSQLETALLEILSQHLCLEIDELEKQTKQSKKQIVAALNSLAKEDKASVVNYDFASLNSKLNEAHCLLADIWQRKKEISPADFRDALGTTRKYAMAILAYFDDHGVTRRLNNSRVLLKNPKRD
ncbi:MAG TPA: selenocysteine-specific translation elongation factor [Planktothrix sp.]